MLYTRGCVGKRADGTVPESAAEQSEVVFANLTAILEDAGMGKITIMFRLPPITHARCPASLKRKQACVVLT